MFECIRSFLVLHFVLSLYRQLITKSLIHYITQGPVKIYAQNCLQAPAE